MKSVTRSQGPDQQEISRKKQELEELEQELADQELDLSTARRDLHVFETRYQQKVGCKYVELDQLKASVLEMATRIHPDSRDFQARRRPRASRPTSPPTTGRRTGRRWILPNPPKN